MASWRRHVTKPIDRYARFASRHPAWIVTVALALTFTSVFIAVQWLRSERSTTALYDPDSPERKQYERYVQKFGEPDDLIVVVAGKTPPHRREFIQQLVYRLDLEPAAGIKHLFFQIPLKTFASFLYASEAELVDLREMLRKQRGVLDRFLRASNFEELFLALDRELASGLEKPGAPEEAKRFFRGLHRFLLSLEHSIRGDEDSPSVWLAEWGQGVASEIGGIDGEGFLTAEQGDLHLLFVKPADVSADTARSIQLVRTVRRQIDQLLPHFAGLEVGLTGEPALTHDEFTTSERDMLWASLFALATTALIFFVSFRSFLRPLLGFSCLLMGVALTFGFVTVTLGHLNLFSLTFAVILIGLGTQYGIHIIARYEEERLRGRTISNTVHTLLTATVPSLWIGALTTAAAFYATLAIDFKGFRELGFIAGSGVLICFVVMSFVLPAFLVLHEHFLGGTFAERSWLRLRPSSDWSERVFGLFIRWPKTLLVGGVLLSVGSVIGYVRWGPQPRFDYNLLNLQAEGTEAVSFEKRLLETEVSPRFAVFMADSASEVRRLTERLKTSPAIGKVESLFSLLPEVTENKLKVVHEIAASLEEKLQFGNRSTRSEVVTTALGRLAETLAQVQEKLFAAGAIDALTEASAVTDELQKLQHFFHDHPTQTLASHLNRLQEAIATDIRDWLRGERTRQELAKDDLPGPLRERLQSADGSYAVYAYPAGSIWDREGLTGYVRALRAVSPEVTGPPLQMFDALQAMATGWYQAAAIAAVVIFALFLYDFRSVGWALLASLPLAFGITWSYGGLALVGLRWNLVNLIALPLVLGIGADCGIHLIHRFREEKKGDLSFVLSSTGKAVTVAYADTITSFLGLAVATHRGLASLGQVIIWGIFCCYLAGILLLPALLTLLRPLCQKSPLADPGSHQEASTTLHTRLPR